MKDLLDYTGCRAIIYHGTSKEMVAEAKVLRYARQTRTLAVKRDSHTASLPDQVLVLLLGAEAPVEFQGTVHRSGADPNIMEIALFRGKTKEDRISMRYPIDAQAVVDHFYISKKIFPTHRVMRVQVLNISAAGCLLHCQTPFFNIGTIFQMEMELFGKQARINATVVRMKPVDECYAEYGCRFYFPNA